MTPETLVSGSRHDDLELRPEDLLFCSVATEPSEQQVGIGRTLLAAAEMRARQTKRSVIRFHRGGANLQHLVSWYSRHGFMVEQIERRDDRDVAHMVKQLS